MGDFRYFVGKLSLLMLFQRTAEIAIKTRKTTLVTSILLLGFSLPVSAQEDLADKHFGFGEFSTLFNPGTRKEVFGPFYYRQQTELSDTWAIPPLFSHTDWIGGDAEEYDFAYPILTFDRFGGEYRWQLGQLFSFAGGQNQSEVPRDRFTLFPIYFQQRSPDPQYNYTAVFPFYGHLQNRIFRSEIDFVMWPFYVKTIKRRQANPLTETLFPSEPERTINPRRGELTTYNYFLPFVHLRYGDGLFGWQAWPFVGREHKEVTWMTNTWDEAEMVPGHDHRFVLWPFYLKQERGIGSENVEHDLLVFPFYRQLRSPLRDSTSYLTPLGLTLTDDRGKKYQEVDAPWPFIVFAWGEGKTTRRIWPLFSRAQTATAQSDFYLWPAYTYKRIHSESLDRRRTRIFFFLYSRVREENTETAMTRTRTDFWPLFTHQRELDGRSRLQVLALLEPILPASKSIERNYSPLWSLWRSEQNPNTESSSQSLLWNLYRREVKGTTRKGSLLFGLFQYESTAEKRHWRLFYLPLNQTEKDSAHVPEHR